MNKLVWCAKALKDYSEDEYITIFEKCYPTEKEAWVALDKVGGCVKTVVPFNLVGGINS